MAKEEQVYLIDDDQDFREATREILVEEKMTTRAFSDGKQVLDILDPEWGGVILCDVKMAGLDGFQLLSLVKQVAPDVPFIMITGHGDVRLAIEAIKSGAYDFLEKPVQPDFLLGMMRRTLNARRMMLENQRLRRRVSNKGGIRSRLIGQSRSMKECRNALINLAPLPLTVSFSGETGTGKALAAQMLHDFGEGEGEFQTIGCGTTAADELKHELAMINDPAGTLFFRGVHKLDHSGQALLADYLRRKDRPRVAVSLTTTATDGERQQLLNDELYYLVNVANIELPALRDRKNDIHLLLETFLLEAAARFDRPLPKINKDMLRQFERHDWPGNVRELRNVAERMVIELPIILEDRNQDADSVRYSYDHAMHNFERALLEQTLRETGGRKGDAAELLSIPRKRLYLRMKVVGLSKTS